jgi:hypothetical protein
MDVDKNTGLLHPEYKARPSSSHRALLCHLRCVLMRHVRMICECRRWWCTALRSKCCRSEEWMKWSTATSSAALWVGSVFAHCFVRCAALFVVLMWCPTA